MRRRRVLAFSAAVACVFVMTAHLWAQSGRRTNARPAAEQRAGPPDGADRAASPERLVQQHARAPLQRDLTAMELFRPGYSFWRHIFTVPDGRVAFGSALDGRLLATFPANGHWPREGVWERSLLLQS